jgi:ABC-type sugar transport system ATPase subunit
VPVDEDGLARRAGPTRCPGSVGRTRLRGGGRPASGVDELASDGIPAEVEVVEEIGADSYVFAAAEVGRLVARRETKYAPERGDRVSLRPKAGEAHLFDRATGVRLA